MQKRACVAREQLCSAAAADVIFENVQGGICGVTNKGRHYHLCPDSSLRTLRACGKVVKGWLLIDKANLSEGRPVVGRKDAVDGEPFRLWFGVIA